MEEYRQYIEVAKRVLQREDNWMEFKKIMLRSIPPRIRKSFSTRHPKTKKQSLNEFEKKIIDIYLQETGILLRIGEKHE